MNNQNKTANVSVPLPKREGPGVGPEGKDSFYRIDYLRNSFDREPKQVADGIFIELLMRQPQVAVDIDRVRRGESEAKSYLPSIIWGGSFEGRERRDSNVVSSGLFCSDIDHISEDAEGARQYYADHFGGREDELGIVFAHVSPSGTGLHVVALCQEGCNSIAECQARLAALTQSVYDPVCKNMGRIFYLSSYKDIIYNDIKV